jgi:hypothetical protein
MVLGVIWLPMDLVYVVMKQSCIVHRSNASWDSYALPGKAPDDLMMAGISMGRSIWTWFWSGGVSARSRRRCEGVVSL